MATELPEITVTAEETPPKKPVDTGPDAVVAQPGPATAVESGELIRTQSADGVTHEFPAGTDQAIVDKAMKTYAQEHADKSTTLGQMAVGFMSPIEGSAQFLSDITPKPVRETINTFNNWVSKKTGLVAELPPGGMDQRVQEREAAIREYRGMNRDNIDWARMGGDLLNPMNYIGGGLIGGTGKLANVARAGAAGLVSSTMQPVADPDYWREKQKQAVIGTVFGLGTGAAASAAGQGLDAVGAYIARKKPEFLENEAVKKIVKRISQDQKASGPSAQDMIDIVNAGNKPVTLADVGGANVKGLAGNVARQPGESRAIATQLIGQRDEAAAQRISQDIETYMHGGPSSYQTQEMLLGARSSASTPAYKDAYALKNIWSPRLQNFIDDPDFKKGLNRGWHLERLRALAEGRKITATELGVDIDMEGNVKLVEVPNMRLLDMAKRGIDAMIADTRDPITGRLSAHGVALNQARHAYVRELEALDMSGAYKRARAAWEGPSASKDAVQLGRAVFQHSPEEMAAEVAKLSPANREFGRIGVADMLKERLAKTGLSGDEAKAIIKNPWMRDQLRPWFRSREEFDKFTDSISTETQMFETGRKVLGGSQTAERVAEDTSVENAYSAAKVMRDITGGNWGALRAAVDAWRLFRDLGRGNDPAFNEKIAHIVFATQIKPEMASKLTGQTPINLVNPLEKTGQSVSAAGVPSAAAVGVPQKNQTGGNQIPQFAEGGVVTQPTVAMIGEKGPEAVVPLDDPAAAQQAANVAAMRQRRAVMGPQNNMQTAQPFTPTESVLPQEPSNLLADTNPAMAAQQAREAAAGRQQQAVRPSGGRQEGEFTEGLFDLAIPGRNVGRLIGQGEYGEAAVQAGMQAVPFAGKALGAAAQAAPAITKTAAAATAALTSLFMDSATGKSQLSPEAQDKLRFMQEKSKLEQKQRTEEAVRRKQEADEKATRDAQTAQQSAQTQADLQAKLAKIEADKEKEKLRIEQERQESERRVAEESVKANAAENKRLAELPFRERHPDAALKLTLGGIAVAALIPGASEAYKKWAFNSYVREWEKLDKAASEALLKGTAAEQQLAVNKLSAAAAKKAEQEGKLHEFPWLTQLGSAGAAVEGGLIPSEVDITQPKESEAHKSAVEFFSSPSEWGRLGALYAGGTLAGITSKEAAGALIPTRKAPVGAEGAIKTYEQQAAARKKAESAAKSAQTRAAKKAKEEAEAKKKAEEPEKEPRKAKVPRGGAKIYGLREE